ncbi:MAG TPA: dCTP deaminase [Candidatus Saccharimonadales bacterium]|nr:dCTP deaminase [Candidatus Saccharimonadales bacterium]
MDETAAPPADPQPVLGAVFSDREILAARETGQIVIDPFVPENVNSSSVDVRLANNFYRMEGPDTQDTLNPMDEESVRSYYKGPFKGEPNAVWCAKHHRTPFRGLSPEHPIVVLRPHERVLAHTVESIGIRYRGTTLMKARSTLGRLGIVVCKDAGWGDTGYIRQWTMEIQNDNNASVVLPYGMRVAQIVFFHMEAADIDYGLTGKYQQGTDPGELKQLWTPEAMLPKSYNDTLILPEDL